MNDAMVRASTHLFEHVGNNPIPQGLEAKNMSMCFSSLDKHK